jgi:lysyl-tRNA synthetase class 1
MSGVVQENVVKEHWPVHVAKKIIEFKGDLPVYTIAAGITPSGVVHIGNFREIMTVHLVGVALRKLGKNVRFIYSWDDYDVFRKIPNNFPNKELLEKYLRQPIVDVPDPFGCHSNYAEHNEKVLEEELPSMGIFPEFIYQSKKYRSCVYAEGMKKALLNKDKIKVILDKWRADDLEENWNPVRVFCERCNTDRTKVEGYDGAYSLTYSCECGFRDTFDFRKKGIAKLQWRVDWPMRWDFEKVKFEPSGKEHSSEGGSNTTANEIVREVYGYEPPFHIMYEFISIKGTGGKMSSSKGNTIDLKEMKSVYEPCVIKYIFVRPIPSKSFEVSFDGDVIAIYDSFDRLERVYFGLEPSDKENTIEQLKSIYEFSAVEIPASMPFQPGFRHITTILQLNLFDEAKTYDYFKSGVKTSFDDVRLKTRISCAKHWLLNYAPDQFVFRVQDRASDSALRMPVLHKSALREFSDLLFDGMSENEIGEVFKKVAESNNIPFVDLFRSSYLLLLGKERGPKLFQLIENVGVQKFKSLVVDLLSRNVEEKKRVLLPGQKELLSKVGFLVDVEVKSVFPSARVGVLFVEGIDNSRDISGVLPLIRAEEQSFREKYFGKDLSSLRGIKVWREAYSLFGAKPKDYKSSIEALSKRVLKGEQLPSINPLVDIYNYISLKYVLPVGGVDLSKVVGDIRLCFANGSENFVKMGSSNVEHPEKGEVIYKDDKEVICRRWNWRESENTKITSSTSRALIFVESLVVDDLLEDALIELAGLVENYLGGSVLKFVV